MEKTFIDDNYSNFSFKNPFRNNQTALNQNQVGGATGLFANKRIIASILEAYRQKIKREQEIKATLQVIKSQEAYNDLQKELIGLQKQLASMQSDLMKKGGISAQSTQKLVSQIEQNPNVEISKQLETIDEIPSEVVDDVKKEEKVVEEIKKENGVSDKKGGLPKWLLPALVIGGVAYFVFRKK